MKSFVLKGSNGDSAAAHIKTPTATALLVKAVLVIPDEEKNRMNDSVKGKSPQKCKIIHKSRNLQLKKRI